MELPKDGGAPRKDSVDARRKIAEMAVKLAKAGEISLEAAVDPVVDAT